MRMKQNIFPTMHITAVDVLSHKKWKKLARSRLLITEYPPSQKLSFL